MVHIVGEEINGGGAGVVEMEKKNRSKSEGEKEEITRPAENVANMTESSWMEKRKQEEEEEKEEVEAKSLYWKTIKTSSTKYGKKSKRSPLPNHYKFRRLWESRLDSRRTYEPSKNIPMSVPGMKANNKGRSEGGGGGRGGGSKTKRNRHHINKI